MCVLEAGAVRKRWGMTQPFRVQRSRARGWRMPENTVSVTRPGKYGNPFVIGGYYMRGDVRGPNAPLAFIYTQACGEEFADSRFTKIETAEQAFEWFEWYCEATKRKVPELRGKNLACWCPIGSDCHADVLLRIANS